MTTPQPMMPLKPGLTSGVPPGVWPRYLTVAISVWLFISAFAWQHSYAMRNNTWIVAILMFIAAMWAIRTPVMRYANTALAAWLFLSTIAMYQFATTVWNNILVAIAVFVISLIPSQFEGSGPRMAPR